MNIKLLCDTRVNGESCVNGDVVDANDRDARYLINRKMAEKTSKDEEPTQKSFKTIIVMNRSCRVTGQHRDIGDLVKVNDADYRFLLGSCSASSLKDVFSDTLLKLSEDNDEHWTKDDKPKVSILKKEGLKINDQQRDVLWHDYQNAEKI